MQASHSPQASHAVSVLDKAAAAYWHAYQTGAPIGEGVAYEKQLRACQFDGSPASIELLAQLLVAVKQDLAKRNMSEEALIAQPMLRNFVLFVGFYLGRVAAQILQMTPTWQTWQDLQRQYPKADFAHGNAFYYAGAMLPMQGHAVLPVPFFALMHVGAALFDTVHTHPITGTAATNNLSMAVASYVQTVRQWHMRQSQPPTAHTAQPLRTKEQSRQQPKPMAHVQTTAAKIHPTPSKKEGSQNDHTVFGEVNQDIKNLPAANTTAQAEYEEAVAIVDKFNEILAKKIAAGEVEIVFGQQQIEMLQRAVARIQKIADMGNTNALLSLSLCYFKGIAMPQDLHKGVEMAFKAAERNDMRAYKFLSRLYYQGVGVEQSTEQGEKWLARAAEGGHPEAKRIQEQLMRIKVMQDDFRIEAKKDKNYLLWGLVLGVIFLFVVWVIGRFSIR